MSELDFYRILLIAWATLALVVLATLLRVAAPYGRHWRPGWGPTLPAPTAWLLMELPAVLVLGFLYLVGERRGELVPTIFLAMWQAHYLYRALVYPRLLASASRGVPLSVVLMAVFFHLGNGYLNGRILFSLGPDYPPAWLRTTPLLVGVVLFFGGMALHVRADRRLRALRAEAGGYSVPRGGLFERVSCPNYLGEIVQWLGWALATWTLAGFAFALWTFANLAPRALAHHRWYRERFADYPPRRKALLPYLL